MRAFARLLARARSRGALILYVSTALVGVATAGAAVVGTGEAEPVRAEGAPSSPTTTTSTMASEPTTTSAPPTSTTSTSPTTPTTSAPDSSHDPAIAASALLTTDDLPGWEPDDTFDLGAQLFWGAPSCMRPTLALFAGVTGEASTLVTKFRHEGDFAHGHMIGVATKTYEHPGLAEQAIERMRDGDVLACLADVTATMTPNTVTIDRRSFAAVDLGIEGTAAWRAEVPTPDGMTLRFDLAAGHTGRGTALAAIASIVGKQSTSLTMRDVLGRSLHRLHAGLDT